MHVENKRKAGTEHRDRRERPHRPFAVDGITAIDQARKRASQLGLDDEVDQLDVQRDILVLCVQPLCFDTLGNVEHSALLVKERAVCDDEAVCVRNVVVTYGNAALEHIGRRTQFDALRNLPGTRRRRHEIRDGGQIIEDAPKTRAQLV